MSRAPMKEKDLMRLCTDWLSAKGYFFMRLNAGFFKFEHAGKSRVFRGHKPGTADLLVMANMKRNHYPENLLNMRGEKLECGVVVMSCPTAVFCELKAQRGVQSPAQKLFEQEVTTRGMSYKLIRSLEDLQAVLEAR